jgi:hypothetical protein
MKGIGTPEHWEPFQPAYDEGVGLVPAAGGPVGNPQTDGAGASLNLRWALGDQGRTGSKNDVRTLEMWKSGRLIKPCAVVTIVICRGQTAAG